MSTYFTVGEKRILVVKNDKYSEKATAALEKDAVVFETLDGLISHGGAMACLLSNSRNTPAILMTSLMDPFVRECAFYHELGHLYYGHPGNTQEYSDQEKMLKEFEADAYMQKSVGRFQSFVALSVLSKSNPQQRNVINLRVTALLLGKWSWKYLVK